MSHKLDATLTANRSGMFELSREQLQIIQDSDNDATKEILKLRADNKALLDALQELVDSLDFNAYLKPGMHEIVGKARIAIEQSVTNQ